MTFITAQHNCNPISKSMITVIDEDEIKIGSSLDPVFVTPEILPSNTNDHDTKNITINEDDRFIEYVVDSLLNLDASPSDFSTDILTQALPRIKAAKLDCVKDKNYIMADKIKKIQNEVSHAITISHFTQQCNDRVQSIIEKQDIAQRDLDFIVEEWDHRYEELENQIDIKKRTLYFEQQSELQKFDASAEYQLNNVKYKPSPKTLSIRKKEDGLVKNENYLEAEKIKRKAERLELKQEEICKMRLTSDLELNRKSLLERQKAQFQIIEQWAEERRKDYAKARDIEIQAALKRVQNYEKMLLNINRKGFSPNPNLGFTTNNISKKEARKTSKKIDTRPISKLTAPVDSKRKKLSVMCYRPYCPSRSKPRSSYTRKVNSFI